LGREEIRGDNAQNRRMSDVMAFAAVREETIDAATTTATATATPLSLPEMQQTIGGHSGVTAE